MSRPAIKKCGPTLRVVLYVAQRRITFLAFVLCMSSALAQDPTPRILAKVNHRAITSVDVERELAIALGARPIDAAVRPALAAKTLEQLINRELVLKYLADTKQAASEADVELAVERLKQQLARREEKFEDYLKLRRLDVDSLRRGFAWQIGWSRLLEKYLTDASLQRFFDKHRRDFDGTELRVAHILFKLEKNADAAARTAALDAANKLLEQIRGGQITFADAAKAHSAGPSRDVGGDIGFISRHEPMPESFSSAAFALDRDAISPPIETAFGIHLIRCLEIKPGTKTWTDTRADLELVVTEHLFNWCADQVRPSAKIEP